MAPGRTAAPSLLALIVVALGAGACEGDGPPGLDDDDVMPRDGGAEPPGDAGEAPGEDGGPMAGPDAGTAPDAGPGVDPTETCAAWNQASSDVAEGDWSGDADPAVCDAGDMDAGWRDRALRLANAYRQLAALPDLTLSPERNAGAQACALVLHAADALSHYPPESWDCWTEVGYDAAGRSNIATTPAVQSVSLYMIDPGAGNASTLGHRRWILGNWIGATGFGSTSEYSCMWTAGGPGVADAVITAFPPPGVFPIQAANLVGLHPFTDLDETGWSIQSDAVELASATVDVFVDGAPVDVEVDALLPNYGSRHALAIRYTDFSLAVGSTYRVELSDVELPSGEDALTYEFTVVDCDR